jgi:hypothetical protein
MISVNVLISFLYPLRAEDQKIGDTKTRMKEYIYDKDLVREFLQLMPLPGKFYIQSANLITKRQDNQSNSIQQGYNRKSANVIKVKTSKSKSSAQLTDNIRIY